jgi:hypothetical protein
MSGRLASSFLRASNQGSTSPSRKRRRPSESAVNGSSPSSAGDVGEVGDAGERGAATCLLRGTVGEIEAAEGGADVTLRCLAETTAVAAASGHPPREKFVEGTKTILTARGSGLVTSMYRDMQNGLPVEVEHILGDLTSRARRLGLDTPFLDAATVQLRVYLNRLLQKA